VVIPTEIKDTFNPGSFTRLKKDIFSLRISPGWTLKKTVGPPAKFFELYLTVVKLSGTRAVVPYTHSGFFFETLFFVSSGKTSRD
jgi:hypothetical protein